MAIELPAAQWSRNLQAAVRNAVGQLPEDLRMAVILCVWQELSLAVAADILNISIKAVESRL